MNPISPDIIPDGKWRFDMRPMVGVRTRDDVGEVYIMDRSIPNMIKDVERVTIGKQVYLPERTCKFISSKGLDYPPVCSECGYELGIYDCEWLDDGTYRYDGNYCPNCGRRVVK